MVVGIAKDNPAWGYDRIAGAIRNRGHKVSDQTVGNILRRSGVAPSPERRRNTTWASFIRQHKEVLWASDFFTTEIWTGIGLATYYVLFFIHVGTRRIVLGAFALKPALRPEAPRRELGDPAKERRGRPTGDHAGGEEVMQNIYAKHLLCSSLRYDIKCSHFISYCRH